MKNVFIIGSKGIPANYGGFETFVDKLTENRKTEDIKYHVSCLADDNNEFIHNDARCFNVKVPNIGPAKAVYYDIKALKECIKYIKENKIEDAIIYVLACRIGPFIGRYKRIIKGLGAKLYVNPDGHEWKRGKWNALIKKYWKISEQLMVKHSDLLICDSKAIEKYIQEDYKQYRPKTTFIAYGADVNKSNLTSEASELTDWYSKHDIKENEYYLIVGRFVPENNYELMIREFMKSKSEKDLVIISNVSNNAFYNKLLENTNFTNDKRIKFVGTVYNQELLKKIREQAYGYIHGHEVGGTNPSLLEALASTQLNLLLNVGFNKEVGEDGAVYFSKEDYNLAKLIEKCDLYANEELEAFDFKSTNRILNEYSWNKIVSDYEGLFLEVTNIALNEFSYKEISTEYESLSLK